MQIKYHTEELNKVIKNLADLLGISIIVFDNNGNSLAQYSSSDDYCSGLQRVLGLSEKCRLSDFELIKRCKKSKQIESHICHAGLCDLAMPIIKDNILAAYVILGRIRSPQSPKNPRYELQSDNTYTLYEKITSFSDNQVENLTALLPHIMFDTAITIEKNLLADDISEYIRSNLSEDLSVKALCNRYYISKNTLYKLFKNEYYCTVNEFITQARIKEAKRLLLNTKQPIIRIAEKVGINNYTYFCRLFKKHTGSSPSEFKRIL